MLHTKFHGNRPAGSTEDDFRRILPYTVRLPVPGHFFSCVVSKYLLRENEISVFTIIKHYHSPK